MRVFNKKFIHIVRDEKFIDSAYRDFEEAAPNQNVFLIIGLIKKLKFIKSAKVFFIRPRVLWLFAPLSHFFAKAVIFHSIGSVFEENLLLKINSKTNIAWISWGYDLFPRLKNIEEYLFPITKGFYNSYSYSNETINDQLNGNFKRSFKVKPSNIDLISRINFISPVLKSEFNLLSNSFIIENQKYLRWNYLSLEEDVISKNSEINISGKSLLLGHSGSIWLNHLDGLKELDQLDLEFDQIILPCSYGDERYISLLKESLKEKSETIQLIDHFLPYEEYVKVLEKCKYFLINTERQIGLGNILFFLYYGGFVVIRKNNPVVEWMSELEIPFTELDSSDFILVKGGDLETKSTLLSFWGKETKRSLTIDYLAKIGS